MWTEPVPDRPGQTRTRACRVREQDSLLSERRGVVDRIRGVKAWADAQVVDLALLPLEDGAFAAVPRLARHEEADNYNSAKTTPHGTPGRPPLPPDAELLQVQICACRIASLTGTRGSRQVHRTMW